jgi:hypothetical protein
VAHSAYVHLLGITAIGQSGEGMMPQETVKVRGSSSASVCITYRVVSGVGRRYYAVGEAYVAYGVGRKMEA